MTLAVWAKSNVDYGRKLVHSGLDGARCGEEAFLQGTPVAQFRNDSIRHALTPAVIGICSGLLASYPGKRLKSANRALAFALFGGVLGFAAGILWENRRLAESVVHSAAKRISRTRDEHWLEKHPIDYA